MTECRGSVATEGGGGGGCGRGAGPLPKVGTFGISGIKKTGLMHSRVKFSTTKKSTPQLRNRHCEAMRACFPVVRLIRGSSGEDLTCQIFWTGQGPWSYICCGKKYNVQAPVAVLSNLLVQCVVSARMTAPETQSYKC